MKTTKLLIALTLCVFLCVMLGTFVNHAHAQMKKAAGAAGMGGTDGGVGGDKGLSEKKGMSVIMDSKKKSDPTKTPSTLKKTIGLGSIFVMIAVVKWL